MSITRHSSDVEVHKSYVPEIVPVKLFLDKQREYLRKESERSLLIGIEMMLGAQEHKAAVNQVKLQEQNETDPLIGAGPPERAAKRPVKSQADQLPKRQKASTARLPTQEQNESHSDIKVTPLDRAGLRKRPAAQKDICIEYENVSCAENLSSAQQTRRQIINKRPLLSRYSPRVGEGFGIIGDVSNSCSVDTSLFCMFAYLSVFDDYLVRGEQEMDCKNYQQIIDHLRESIVYPLRKFGSVDKDSIEHFRQLLQNTRPMSPGQQSLTSRQMDPGDVIELLLNVVFRTKDISFMNPHRVHHALLFDEQTANRDTFPSVQSFLSSGLVLDKSISCLIISVGKSGVVEGESIYRAIFPNPEIDVTSCIVQAGEICLKCGKGATLVCDECMLHCQNFNDRLYCKSCATAHFDLTNHRPVSISPSLTERQPQPRNIMKLCSVICVEHDIDSNRGHVTSFSRTWDEKVPWLFFNSMAKASGEGLVKIPATEDASSLTKLLSDHRTVRATLHGQIPLISHFFKNGYIYIYKA